MLKLRAVGIIALLLVGSILYLYFKNKEKGLIPEQGEMYQVRYDQEGGIFGFCDHLLVYYDGRAEIFNCKGKNYKFSISETEKIRLTNLFDNYQSYTDKKEDPAVADKMTRSIIFKGGGTKEMTQSQKEELWNLIYDIFLNSSKAIN